MKKLLAVSMAAVMTLSLSCAAFTDEEAVAGMTDFEWAAMKAVLDQADINGEFVSFDDAGMKVWIPDLYEETELTDEDIENEYLGWYVSEEQDDGEYGQIGIGLYDMGDHSIDEYIDALKEAGYDSAEPVTVNGMDGALHFINEDGYDAVLLAVLGEDGRIFEVSVHPVSTEEYTAVAYAILSSIQPDGASGDEEASADSDNESADSDDESEKSGDEESGDVEEFNWEDVENEEDADEMISLGKFVTFDEINCKMWVPVSVMQEDDLTDEDKENGFVARYVMADGDAAVGVQYIDASGLSLKDYKAILEKMDEASEVTDVVVNGIQGVAYEIKDQDSCHVSFTTDYGYILEFSWVPVSNENVKALAGIMMSSIQEA
jgi:hypothetical protein